MHPFDSVTPSLEQQKLMRLARMDAEQLLSRAELLPHSRHKSLFLTSLENAMMWLNKAITHSQTETLEQEPPDGNDTDSDLDAA